MPLAEFGEHDAVLVRDAVQPRGQAARVVVADGHEQAVRGGVNLPAVGGEEPGQQRQVVRELRRDAHGRFGAAEELPRRAGIDTGAAFDHDQPVAHLLDLGQQVRGDKYGALLSGHSSDELADLAHADRVQPVGRLVEDQQLRLAEQGAGDPKPLLHAERVLPEAVPAAVGKPDELEQLGDLSGVLAAHRCQHPQVLRAGEPEVERRALDEGADPWHVVGWVRERDAEDVARP